MRNSSFASLALFVSVVVSLALPGRAQDPCTVGDPETCDVDGNVVFCNAGKKRKGGQKKRVE